MIDTYLLSRFKPSLVKNYQCDQIRVAKRVKFIFYRTSEFFRTLRISGAPESKAPDFWLPAAFFYYYRESEIRKKQHDF